MKEIPLPDLEGEEPEEVLEYSTGQFRVAKTDSADVLPKVFAETSSCWSCSLGVSLFLFCWLQTICAFCVTVASLSCFLS